jgi:hypothetical protein
MTGHFRRYALKTMDLQQYNHERYLELKRMLKIQSKVTCPCGSKSKYARFGRHQNSKIHLDYMSSISPP